MRYILIALSITLAGCSVNHEFSSATTTRSSTMVDVRFPLKDRLAYNKTIVVLFQDNPTITIKGKVIKIDGRHISADTEKCTIILRKSTGLSCLKHELYKCIYGRWHGTELNREFCE